MLGRGLFQTKAHHGASQELNQLQLSLSQPLSTVRLKQTFPELVSDHPVLHCQALAEGREHPWQV